MIAITNMVGSEANVAMAAGDGGATHRHWDGDGAQAGCAGLGCGVGLGVSRRRGGGRESSIPWARRGGQGATAKVGSDALGHACEVRPRETGLSRADMGLTDRLAGA